MPTSTIYLHSLRDYLTNLNICVNLQKTTCHDLKNQRISTRLFLILFPIAVVILTVYASISPITKTVTVKEPSFSVYTGLYERYPQTIICPCSQTTIAYGNFLSFNPAFHQVCQSYFVSDEWIKHLNFQGQYAYYLDIRKIGSASFQVISSLCQISQQTVKEELLTLNSTSVISLSLIPSSVFLSQIEAAVNLFEQTTINTFLTTLSLNRNVTATNNIMTTLQTNAAIQLLTRADFDGGFGLNYISFQYGADNCSCLLTSQCVEEMVIYDSTSASVQFTVSNFFTGCYVLEAVLQSSLTCFYDKSSCLTQLQFYLADSSPYPLTTNVTVLNSSLSSQYATTTTLEEMIENLMLEKWGSEIVFEKYFQECLPSSCTFSFTSRNSMLYIATTVSGLIGGVATVLSFLVPLIIEHLRRGKKLVENIGEALAEEDYGELYCRKSELKLICVFPQELQETAF